MKLTSKDFAAKGRNAAQDCGVFFFCGQDEAGASAAAGDLAGWLPEPGERVEMSGADLRGANLHSADLAGAYLRDADLTGANLRDADLAGADLGGWDRDPATGFARRKA